jgi:hypothetical protein
VTREIDYKPVAVEVLGVIVYCANDIIATQLIAHIEHNGVDVPTVIKTPHVYAFDSLTAYKHFLQVYNDINNRK